MTDRSIEDGKIQVRAVVFDYGKVLCHPQSAADVESMALTCGMAVPRFRDLYWKFRMAYDREDLNADTYWEAVAREAGLTFNREQIEKVRLLDCKSWSRQNDATLQWVEQLRAAGFRRAILSNMPFEISRYLMAHCKWFSLFQHLVFSCDVRRAKPEPEIYISCLEMLQLAPHEVLFLDDIVVNVEAAARIGIHGVVFDTVEQTSARVAKRFAIPVPNSRQDRSSVGMEM